MPQSKNQFKKYSSSSLLVVFLLLSTLGLTASRAPSSSFLKQPVQTEIVFSSARSASVSVLHYATINLPTLVCVSVFPPNYFLANQYYGQAVGTLLRNTLARTRLFEVEHLIHFIPHLSEEFPAPPHRG